MICGNRKERNNKEEAEEVDDDQLVTFDVNDGSLSYLIPTSSDIRYCVVDATIIAACIYHIQFHSTLIHISIAGTIQDERYERTNDESMERNETIV